MKPGIRMLIKMLLTLFSPAAQAINHKFNYPKDDGLMWYYRFGDFFAVAGCLEATSRL